MSMVRNHSYQRGKVVFLLQDLKIRNTQTNSVCQMQCLKDGEHYTMRHWQIDLHTKIPHHFIIRVSSLNKIRHCTLECRKGNYPPPAD